MNLLQVTPPAPNLFYRHRDPLDLRLGSAVGRTEATGPIVIDETIRESRSYRSADFVIIGCPQDEGVRRNEGRAGAEGAPAEIRRYLYRLALGPLEGLWSRRRVVLGLGGAEELDLARAPVLFDLGDTLTDGPLEEIHMRHRAIVEQALRDGKTVISLGGGNDLSYPDAAAAAAVFPGLLAFNVDAHLDVRDEEPRNSGTPYRQLLDQAFIEPENFVELGYQPFAVAKAHLAALKSRGVSAYSLGEARSRGFGEVVREHLRKSADAVFWGIDMDVVSSAFAPGVSAPNPAGLYPEELLDLSRRAGLESRSRLFEVTEVNPRFDLDGRTSRLAAVAVYAFLSGRAESSSTKEETDV